MTVSEGNTISFVSLKADSAYCLACFPMMTMDQVLVWITFSQAKLVTELKVVSRLEFSSEISLLMSTGFDLFMNALTCVKHFSQHQIPQVGGM